MNCRQANRLLPLWIGRDLADASESEDLRGHLENCPVCSSRQLRLQESLEALQSLSAGMLEGNSHIARRPSLWPRLALVLGEVPRRRDQFNGWIPAAAMTLAATVMTVVSVLQFQREMGNSAPTAWNLPSAERLSERDLFRSDERFAPGAPNRDAPVRGLVKQPATNNW